MPRTTAFHSRLAPINKTGIWKNWSGYLVAPSYQHAVVNEYYAIRNSVSLLDTSPLFKYRISGRDSLALLQYVMARDFANCDTGDALYTCWCNSDGFVIQDGVALRTGDHEFFLTSAEPSLRYFQVQAKVASLHDVRVEDVSAAYGILALQGPHAHHVIRQLTNDATKLPYFAVTKTKIGETPAIISRTGFTGDLGYEIWVSAQHAIQIWDALMEAGRGFNITPIGTTALKMARVEAGLLLLDVDFHSSKHAWVDAQRERPSELGWNWMFRKDNPDREYIGKSALAGSATAESTRWTTVGLSIDWHDYERIHLESGIPAPKHQIYRETTMSVYRRNDTPWDHAGYATSFLFSSLLKKPIAIAKLPLDLATPGTLVDLELPVIHQPKNVVAKVTRMPFFNPKRKTETQE